MSNVSALQNFGENMIEMSPKKGLFRTNSSTIVPRNYRFQNFKNLFYWKKILDNRSKDFAPFLFESERLKLVQKLFCSLLLCEADNEKTRKRNGNGNLSLTLDDVTSCLFADWTPPQSQILEENDLTEELDANESNCVDVKTPVTNSDELEEMSLESEMKPDPKKRSEPPRPRPRTVFLSTVEPIRDGADQVPFYEINNFDL